MPQSSQQLQNALNPTPTTIQTPADSGLFKTAGDQGQSIYYKNPNGTLSVWGLNNLNAGGTYGDKLSNATQALQQKYGIDYNSLPTFNMGDLKFNPYSSSQMFSPFDESKLGSGYTPATGQSSQINTTPNQTASPEMIAASQAAGRSQLADTPQTPPGFTGTQASPDNLSGQTQAMQVPNTPPGFTGTQGAQTPDQLAAALAASGQTPAQNVSQNPQQQSTAGSQAGSATSGSSADQYLQNYLNTLTPTQQESTLQQQLNDLTAKQGNINASRDLGIQGVNEQPIATQFLTGQSAAITNRAATQVGALGAEAAPLQQQLALQQAKRQSAMDVSKAMLDYTKAIPVSYGGSIYDPRTGQVVANNNPGSDPLISQAIQNGQLTPDMLTRYGSASVLETLKQNPDFNFVTGQASKAGQVAAATSGATYKAGAIPGTYTQPNATAANNPPSSGSGTPLASGASGSNVQALQQFLVSKGYMTQADMNTGPGTYGPKTQAAVAAFQKAAGVDTSAGGSGTFGPKTLAAAQGQGYSGGSSNAGVSSGGSSSSASADAAGLRADAASLKTQQAYADSTQRAFNTANQNLQSLVEFMQTAGVNSGSSVPLINSLQDRVKSGLTDAGTIAAYNAALAGLRAEYAQVLSRGGEVTEGQRSQAASLIPDNLTPAQLQQVTDRLKIEGSNAINEATSQVQTIKDRMSGKSTSPSSGSSTGGSTYNGITLPN